MRKSLTFNGIRKPWIHLLEGRRKSPFAPIRNNLIRVMSMAGAHLGNSETDVLYIEQPIGFVVENDEHELQLKDELAEWLVTNEVAPLQFDDEPGRTYYAKVEGTIEDFKRFVDQRKGIVTFLVADGRNYGPEQSYNLHDISVIENKGTAEADPIFEFTTRKKATFAMVSNGDDETAEYNLIGTPADVDEQLVDERTELFTERGETLSSWDIPQSDSSGDFSTTGDAIVIDSWGSGQSWHGPSLMREINPLEDYEIEMYVYVRTENPNQTFSITTNLYDENMKEISMLRLWDKTTNQIRKVAEGRIGEYISNYVNYLISDQNYNLQGQRVWGGVLRIRKEGNKFTFYVARVTQGGRHTSAFTESFIDENNDFTGKLKFIRFDMSNYGNTNTPNEIRIEYIKVTELKEVKVDETPYILDVGDVVTFDHKEDDLLINGEPRNDLKNFGGSFFKLKKGENRIIVTPEDTFDSKVTFRDKYL